MADGVTKDSTVIGEQVKRSIIYRRSDDTREGLSTDYVLTQVVYVIGK